MIRLHAVSHHFGERPVLEGLDLTLSERRIAVVGGNGSGKSTFARLLNGLLVPERGQVLVEGLDTRKDARAIRRKVGFVFQNPDHQIVLPTVEEDLAFGLKNLKLPPADISTRVTAVLRRYGLEDFRHHPAHLLSGGQKQLLALSSVLVMEPRYIVFDEPTTLLDLRNKRRLAQAIHELPQTAIVVSHDLELLRDFDRVLVFDAGRVVVDDVPSVALDAYVRMMA
ncbi:energy-coupling factor ABC transporter ATP-binding protein [Archangium violaceum]|uniref:Cobalt ABC transporter ATP-binding protein n=1 Tax=Archangium violaceum Cb vi76 TaxID=1406225 RepID=A0A084SKR4_9BACT|nr:ATP-binding cassette domain-containing protein [Archangium violaceum]KFA89049.1 cobalt ABC transporter ATP-binding protein [Archangium violaceum Cb vi76]